MYEMDHTRTKFFHVTLYVNTPLRQGCSARETSFKSTYLRSNSAVIMYIVLPAELQCDQAGLRDHPHDEKSSTVTPSYQ